jgi:hypothetical protein
VPPGFCILWIFSSKGKNWVANDQPKPPEKRGMPVWAKIGTLAFMGLGVIVYLVMFLLSSKFMQETIDKLRV